MIGLDTVIKGHESASKEKKVYKELPNGDYEVKVYKMGAWKPTTKNVGVIQKDDNGYTIKDDNDKPVRVFKECTYYNAKIEYVIVAGDFSGQHIFDNVCTHPNMVWKVENLVYALNTGDIPLSKAQKEFINKNMLVEVINKPNIWDEEVTNDDTGLVTTIHHDEKRAEVNAYFKSSLDLTEPAVANIDDLDFDI